MGCVSCKSVHERRKSKVSIGFESELNSCDKNSINIVRVLEFKVQNSIFKVTICSETEL